jgi:hypothetical protein
MSYNFRTVMGQSSYRPWKNWASGDFLVGKYVSESTDSFGNPNYKVEVIEAKFEDGNEPKAGSTFSFNSSGALKKSMEEISVGDILKVIYKGEDTVSKGKFKGKKFHSMEVLVAPSNSIVHPVSSGVEDGDLI